MKTGVVDTGGGLRGIYAAGVFDRWIDLEVSVDLAIGVSAGSANLASFLAHQHGRNRTFYTEYSKRPEYMSMRNFLRSRSYLDLEYIYGTLSVRGGEYPLDYERLRSNRADFLVVATDAETGEPHYFRKDDLAQDCYDPFKASSAIPFVCRPYPIQERLFYDGALSDPLPVDMAFDHGCDRVVLVLTKPRDYVRKPGLDVFFAKRIRKQFPRAAKKLAQRYATYNEALERAKQLESQGRVFILAPDDICGAKTLERNTATLERLYEKGYKDADSALPFLDR